MMIETTIDGRYQIVARIAAGGMGEVYRAHDPVLDREVALKILHPSLADDPGFIDRFRREARSAAMLSHPNIVAVHDWGETQGTYFMIMEFVRGPNLRALLMRDDRLEPAQAIEVVDAVLGALEHAHGQGIVHRDIKPENVMIRASDGVPKVADFGLARAFADARVSQAPGTVTGTVQYLAPEQIEGEQADPRTDLYATGVVLYELLTGQVPFTGETSVAIAYKHLRERVPPPSTVNPGVPVALDRVVLNATARERERRTADARTMRHDLRQSTDGLPPAPPLPDLAASVTPADEVPADRLSTVTIPRTLSPKARRRQRLSRVSRWISVVAVLAVAGWAVWTFLIPHRTTVPDLLGDTLRTAQREAEAAGLEVEVAGEEFDPNVPVNQILTQSLRPGTEADEGSAIRVVVSRGPELEAVPEVIGLPQDAAARRVDEARFEVRILRDYHDTVPAGRVYDQRPDPGFELEVGKEVRILVSRGKPPVQVPGVAGLAQAEATAILEGSGLGVDVTEEFSGTVQQGVVISQQPAADQTVPAESRVTIVVSKGPRTFPLPNVEEQTHDAAVATLQGLGLRIRVVDVPATQGNIVIDTNPEPGEIVQTGQEITIYIGG
jgi:eukaryotic-like serine/threonine-protein kinase